MVVLLMHMINLLEQLISLFSRFRVYLEKREADQLLGVKRDSRWGKTRRDYLKKQPRSEISGRTDNLEVHHKVPVWVWPEGELLESNLMTVTHDEHFMICHAYSWRHYVENIEEVAAYFQKVILNRLPKTT